ncbi:malonate transporter subunit MadL, partial [Haliscomenobacter sp.]|uniref:malonate transporter subunit MadL n=1 Tax=Haliscomenobacter sp. TaxID=2717303 RepID=UPI00336503CD
MYKKRNHSELVAFLFFLLLYFKNESMLIKGVALLAACYIIGQLTGETLGRLLHIDANV